MGKTKRRRPTNREAKWERLEREWERQVKKEDKPEDITLSTPLEMLNQVNTIKVPLTQQYESSPAPLQLPPGVAAIQKEAEEIVNKAVRRRPFSIQSPATDDPSEYGGGLVWWTGGTCW